MTQARQVNVAPSSMAPIEVNIVPKRQSPKPLWLRQRLVVWLGKLYLGRGCDPLGDHKRVERVSGNTAVWHGMLDCLNQG